MTAAFQRLLKVLFHRERLAPSVHSDAAFLVPWIYMCQKLWRPDIAIEYHKKEGIVWVLQLYLALN